MRALAVKSSVILACWCAALAVVWAAPVGQTYYVDSATGSDAHEGLSPATAWQTLAQANSREFAPGDRLLLKAGTAYSGTLSLHGRGTPVAPIVVASMAPGRCRR